MRSANRVIVTMSLVALTATAANAVPDIDLTAQSLINRHVEMSIGGWAWQSVIQSPHFQLDRDVGTASVGMGLLAAYDTTADATAKNSYLAAAEKAADFLVAAQTPSNSGRWPDYYDPAGPASYGYTSIDDGAAGISDFLWRVFERDGNSKYATAALHGMDWLVSMARAPKGASCPGQQCYWYWRDPHNNSTPIYSGLGSGMAGIVYMLDQFAQRTGNARYQQYATAGATYLEAQITSTGAVAERVGGSPSYDTGLYAGAAGDAYVFYSLSRHTTNTRWLSDANRVMAWVRAQAIPQSSGKAWPLSAGRTGNRTLATQIGEGAAGIGWVELQAYKTTGAQADLDAAKSAADWLLSIASIECTGCYSWPAYDGQADFYTSLDLGVGGISVFLHDVSSLTGISGYEIGAQKAQAWLTYVQTQDNGGATWYQDRNNGTWLNLSEPSWNWGLAGILGSTAIINDGWRIDMPRDVPGF